MASLYVEQVVWVVKITLSKRDGTGTDTFYLSDDYWPAESLYSGSLEVLPLLADLPSTDLEIEIEAAARADISLNIINNADFRTWNERFSDLLVTHTFQNALVELRRYIKGVGSITTHAAANIRQTRLKVIDYSFSADNGIMRLVARDVWLEDKEISKKLDSDDFDDLIESANGMIGPWVFGYDKNSTFNVIIDTPFIDASKLFAGWASTGHYMNEASVILVKHNKNEFNDNDWVTCELNPSPFFYGDNGSATVSGVNLADGSVGYVVTAPSTGAGILTFVQGSFYFSGVGTMTADMGRLSAKVYYSVDNQPVGNALAEALFDITALDDAGASVISAYFDKPALVTFGQNFFLELSWSGSDAASSVIVTAGTESGRQYYYNNKTGGAYQAAGADEFFSLGFFLAKRHATYFDDGSGNNIYAWFRFDTDYNDLLRDNLQFKMGFKGLEDNAANDFGAGASTLLSTPARLVDFALREDDKFGLAMTTADVDTTGIAAVSTLQDAAALDFGVAIDSPGETVESFIRKLCRQSRMIFYKKRDGKLSLYYPQSIVTTSILDWGALRADLQTVAIDTTEPSKIVNDFLISYARDPLNRPKSIEVQKKAEANKYSALYELNATTSTDDDNTRETALAASKALYGKREFRENWDYFYDAAGVKIGLKYLSDRFSNPQKRALVRVLAKDFSTLDIFSDLDLRAYGLECVNGTFETQKTFDTNSGGTRFSPVVKLWEAIPVDCYQTGVLKGRVMKIQEQGPFVYLRIETFPDL